MKTLFPMAAVTLLLVVGVGAGPAAFGLAQPEAGGETFEFEHYVTDASLHRRWAILGYRAHPERPWIAVPVTSRSVVPEAISPKAKLSKVGVARQLAMAAAQIKQAPPPARLPRIVAPGMAVTLWQVSGDARIELRGTATNSASLGGVVHVRTGPGRALLTGIARGPGSVELTGLAHQQWGQQ